MGGGGKGVSHEWITAEHVGPHGRLALALVNKCIHPKMSKLHTCNTRTWFSGDL